VGFNYNHNENSYIWFDCFAVISVSSQLLAQVSMSFENLATTQNCTSTACNYVDPGNPGVPHDLPDVGGIPLSYPSSGSALGFVASLIPSRTGSSATGLTDGDFFGYAASTTVSNQLGVGPTDGNQAYLIEDTDGWGTLTFDVALLEFLALTST
ncbi:MAG: hypothetical protein AAFU67_16075, partial [Bacteroidota bacterium]